MANVVEKDATNRNVSATQTDANGNFSLTVKSTDNKIQISYIGYTNEVLSIGERRTFEVVLKEKVQLKDEAVVVAVRKTNSNGLSIPEREMSMATQTMNMDDKQGLSFTSVGEALQGEIAGLDVIASSGNLGSGTTMRLRGTSNIHGSQNPLIVVNGYKLENYDESEFDAENMTDEKWSALLQVSPEDIQSIKVLKDVAATSIWGAEGSNGVIEITTRRGSRGKTRVNFDYKFQGTWKKNGYKMLTGDEYTMMLKESYFNPTQRDVASNIVELMYLQNRPAYYYNYNHNTDWVSAVHQFGQQHQFGVNVSGGGEKATFRVSANYNNQTGHIIKQYYNRLTTRLALDYWVSDRIKFSSDFSMTFSQNKAPYQGGKILSKAYSAMPNMSITRWEAVPGADGLLRPYDTGEWYIMPPAAGSGMSTVLLPNNSGLTSYYLNDMVNNGNPVAISYESKDISSSYTIIPQFSVEYKLLGTQDDETQLNYTGSVYMNATTNSSNSYFPHSLTSNMWDAAGGIDLTSNYESKNLAFNTRHQLIFKPMFDNEEHSFQIMLRGELNTNNSSTQSLSSSGINGGITDPTVKGYLQGSTTGTSVGHSMMGIASMHYSYGSKYSIDATVNATGSTKFGDNKKWAFFPSFSARWNVSDEKFFEPVRKYVHMFAIRAAWGMSGQAPGGEGLYYNQYVKGGVYNGEQSMKPSNLKLTLIRSSKKIGKNLGFNLGLFNFIDADLNIYDERTKDVLNSGTRIPSSTGFSTLAWTNVGEMRNRGWELYINTQNIVKIDKFSMRARFNFSNNINTILSMESSVLDTYNQDFNYQNHSVMQRVQVGNALGGIYGFKYKGVYAYDYDHNGYFLNDDKNQYYDAQGVQNTAKARNMSAPIARDASGNVIYDKMGNPKPMMYNYGGVNYQFQGGDVMYEDINHDGQIDELDIVYLGSSNPRFNGGFGLNFTYGQWQLNTNFNFRLGNKIVNVARLQLEDMRTNKNQSAAVNHRWRKNGQETEIPRAMNAQTGTSYNALISDRYVEKGDYLRFQYLQISYSVPAEKLKRFGLNSLRFSANTNNLFVWTKYKGLDPDHPQSGYAPAQDWNSTPSPRAFNFSLNFGF